MAASSVAAPKQNQMAPVRSPATLAGVPGPIKEKRRNHVLPTLHRRPSERRAQTYESAVMAILAEFPRRDRVHDGDLSDGGGDRTVLA